MGDTTSRHVIKYVLELDEAEVQRHAKAVEDSFNRVTSTPPPASSAPASSGGGKPPTPKQQAETVGETLAKSLTERMQRMFGSSKTVASNAAQQMVQTLASSRIGGAAMGAPAEMMGAVFSKAGLVAAAGPAAVVGAVAAGLYGLYKACQLTSQALSQVKEGFLTANPVKIIDSFSSSLKAAGIMLTLSFGPMGSLPLVVGYFVEKVSNLMGQLISTFGEYNATVVGQVRMTELMSRMLKIQIGQYLQPAMTAWINLLQDILSAMSSHPGVWRAINAVLVTVIKGLDYLFQGMMNFVDALAYAGRILYDAIRLVKAAATGDISGGKEAYNDIQKDVIPANRSANLRDQALMFNRAFIDALVAKAQPGAPAVPGAAPAPHGGPARAPMASMPEFTSKVTLNMDMQLMHESKVKEAVDKIKDRLFIGLKTVRDEATLLNSRIDGHGLGYGL